MDKNRIIIIDGNSLINRAYYAIQRPMITKEGLYTHAVYGFLNMLSKIKTDYEPDYLLVTFDRKAPTFRHKEYTEYKAGRKKMPPELAMQLPLLKEVLAAMNISMLELDGFEADDIIGTVARRGEEEGLAPLIITGDKDELQLATDTTQVIITKKGISEFERYDRQAMIERYGFTPEQFIDYKGLMGDPSDNIPGVPGIGEKTAQKLILEFGTIAQLLARTDEISNEKLRQKIEDNAELAAMSRRLATIYTEVPIEVDFDACRVTEPDYETLIGLYRKLEFNSFLKKLSLSADFQETKAAEPSQRTKREWKLSIISDEKTAAEAAKGIAECREAVLKVETDGNHRGTPEIQSVTILIEDVCYYFNTRDKSIFNELKRCLALRMPAWCGHNLQRDFYALIMNGFEPQLMNTAFDTAIAQYLLEPTRSNYDLNTMVLEYLTEEYPSEKEFLADNGQMELFADTSKKYSEYAGKWCGYVEEIRSILSPKLEAKELEQVFYEVELPLIPVLSSMEAQGFSVDNKELTELGQTLNERIKLCETQVYEMAGEEFNINSPKQLGVILFEKLQLPGAKKTKTGYATGAEILERLQDEYQIVKLILEYRMLTKLSSTYVEGLLPLIDAGGKIHAHFQQTVTTTGRISCTEPNLQNIPIRQELGRQLRKAFVTESPDYVLVGADYSQIELRVLAHLSQDESLIQAFNEGLDIHRITASKVFGIPEDQVSALQRSNAKAVNFGVIYGMSGFGLSNELNITRKEAETYIAEYFKKYERVKEYMDGLVESCKEKGYATTLMNRRRDIHEISAGNFMVRQAGERLAMNTPIQGTAADIIKLAMIKVHQALYRQCQKSRLILQVHDELIIQAHKDELDIVKKLLTENMEQAVTLSVKLSVDLNTGESWYVLK